MINKPQHSTIENSLNLIHITSHNSNYSTDEGDYSELLYVFTSFDRFNSKNYGDSEDKIPFVQFVSEEYIEAKDLKTMFNAVSTYYTYHDANECWPIAIWNDYQYGRSIRIDELIYQERKDECKNIDFDVWLDAALESAIFI